MLILDFPKDGHVKGSKGEEINWDGEALKEMKNLKTLIIRNGHFSQGPTHLPNSLRVLRWRGYDLSSLPSNFRPKKLCILELPDSSLKLHKPIQASVCALVSLYVYELTSNSYDYFYDSFIFYCCCCCCCCRHLHI
jgi:hypothetical protein